MNYQETDSLKNEKLSKEERESIHRGICNILERIQLERSVDFLDNITKKGKQENEK